MNYTYPEPMSYTIGPAPLKITKVKHGVTEVSLSDGRIMRLSLHVDNVRLAEGAADSTAPNLDIDYQIITEVMREPDLPILDVHEVIQ